ncbi:MAG: AMP-binding protein, partial [Thermodesulfobacteriota bacterium]
LATYFGVIKAGAVAVTISYLTTADELKQVLADCRPKAVLAGDDKVGDFQKLKENGDTLLIINSHGDVSCDDLIEKGDANFKTVDRNRHDTCAVLFTGGTTGVPKGAMLSHENIQASLFNVVHFERSSQEDRALCFLPLNHVFAQIHIMQSMVYCGGGLVLHPSYDLERILDSMARHRVSNLYAVPTVYIRMLELSNLRERIASIRYCFSAAASMATEIVRAWKARTGLDIHEAYGMTESASMVTYNHYYSHVVGSVGTPANLVEVQIRDMEGHILKPGEEGEICIHGPNITKGYLNNPQETAAAIQDGWLHSGDLGYVDEQGYLFIVDRLKDMIVTGGENVYPREVEELLYTHPDVLECAVVGLPDKEYGERVTAFIVSPGKTEPNPENIRQFLKERLTGFKVPKAFVFVDDLPKNNAGKLLKRKIRDQYSPQIA